MTDPAERPFRFGVNMTYPAPGPEWAGKCRAAEASGYDTIAVPDHLVAPDPRVARDHPATPSPFPGLVLAAAATERARAGTLVLNTAFYNPLLLARDVATTATLLGGRLELGLGTGYDRAEVESAGLTWKKPGERIAHLESIVDAIRAAVAEAGAPSPPLLIGARGDRMLRYAAAEADTLRPQVESLETELIPEASRLRSKVAAEVHNLSAWKRTPPSPDDQDEPTP